MQSLGDLVVLKPILHSLPQILLQNMHAHILIVPLLRLDVLVAESCGHQRGVKQRVPLGRGIVLQISTSGQQPALGSTYLGY